MLVQQKAQIRRRQMRCGQGEEHDELSESRDLVEEK